MTRVIRYFAEEAIVVRKLGTLLRTVHYVT